MSIYKESLTSDTDYDPSSISCSTSHVGEEFLFDLSFLI